MKVLPIAAVVVIVIALASAAVFISSDSDDIPGIPEETDTISVPNTFDSGEYPSSLDLRDMGLVTPTKDQGRTGTCWAFADLSAIETNLINKGLADSEINLSELHLAYYTFNRSADPLSGLEGDNLIPIAYTYLDSGANSVYTTLTLSAWRGAAYEDSVPFELAADNLVLDNEYESEYILTDTRFINPEDRGAVKKILNSGNSVVMAYYAGDEHGSVTDEEGNITLTFYSNKKDAEANHAVAIIGYDDEFSADNFLTKPPADGAWLVKNSWGDYLDSDGCIWISYYTAGQSTFAAFDAESADIYDHNYQYDGGGAVHQSVTYGKTGYMGNIFESSGNEILKAVSFCLFENINVDYEIMIYTDLKDNSNPTGGTLAHTQTGRTEFAGYYTVELSEPISLKEGELFSVIVKLCDPTGNLHMPVDTDVNIVSPYVDYSVWATSSAVAEAGQSFVSGDGETWKDIGSGGSDNVRVKAFTTDDRSSQ